MSKSGVEKEVDVRRHRLKEELRRWTYLLFIGGVYKISGFVWEVTWQTREKSWYGTGTPVGVGFSVGTKEKEMGETGVGWVVIQNSQDEGLIQKLQ